MTKTRYTLYDTIFDAEESRDVPGFVREDIKEFLTTSNYQTIIIPVEYDCRPDLLSNYFFGTPDLFWILVFVNGIMNSPEGFSAGTTIIVPDINKLRDRL